MKKIGPGIAKILLKTRAASISACTSKCKYGAVKSVHLSCPNHKWTFLDSLAVLALKSGQRVHTNTSHTLGWPKRTD